MGETVRQREAITAASAAVFLLACQLTFFTAMGTRLFLPWRIHWATRCCSSCAVAASILWALRLESRTGGVESRRESRIDGAEALLAQALLRVAGPEGRVGDIATS